MRCTLWTGEWTAGCCWLYPFAVLSVFCGLVESSQSLKRTKMASTKWSLCTQQRDLLLEVRIVINYSTSVC